MELAVLQKFCSIDESRPIITKPFTRGEFTYATDGHIGIRVPALPEFPHNDLAPKIEERWIDIDAYSEYAPPDLSTTTFPETPTDEELESIKCDKCDGEGEIYCHHCGYENECKECSGEGVIGNPKTQEKVAAWKEKVYLRHGKNWLDARIVKKLLEEFPVVEIATPDTKLQPIPFKAGEIRGVIMPVRYLDQQ